MGKPKEMEEKQAFGLFCQQQLFHPDCSSESFHCILTTNPTLCLEKQRGRLTEIYIGIFRAWTGITRVSFASFTCRKIHISLMSVFLFLVFAHHLKINATTGISEKLFFFLVCCNFVINPSLLLQLKLILGFSMLPAEFRVKTKTPVCNEVPLVILEHKPSYKQSFGILFFFYIAFLFQC